MKKYDMQHPIRGKVFEEDMIVDIYDFEINDLKDNVFKSTYKNRDFCIDDFHYLILYREVLKDIYKEAYQQGFKDGKKLVKNKNNKYKEE